MINKERNDGFEREISFGKIINSTKKNIVGWKIKLIEKKIAKKIRKKGKIKIEKMLEARKKKLKKKVEERNWKKKNFEQKNSIENKI